MSGASTPPSQNDTLCICTDSELEWDIGCLLRLELPQIPSYAVLVLNRPISHNQSFVVALWKNAKVTLTTDGGTNHWDALLSQLDTDTLQALKPPDMITGDFDSITEVVLQKFKNLGSKVVHTPNQDATDFTKALLELNTHCQDNNIKLEAVVVICESSGRMDQIMANINTLFLCKENKLLNGEETKVFLMSKDSLTWLLSPGAHVIHVPDQLRLSERAWCSLVPVGQECTNISTTGLKWNLVNRSLKFGALVSTSNTYDGSPTVGVVCSHAVLWSMKIKALVDYEAHHQLLAYLEVNKLLNDKPYGIHKD